MSTIPLIKIILLLAFMVGCCLTGLVKEDQNFPLKRVKRNLLQFGDMIKCATGRSGLAYNGYGCWCGRGGSGTPVDDTDRCCKTHDECYDRAMEEDCRPYSDWYDRSGCTGCGSNNDRCEKLICECDGAAARSIQILVHLCLCCNPTTMKCISGPSTVHIEMGFDGAGTPRRKIPIQERL
ncbi:neutral phospholipase A2 3-like [Orbicella faveolata]|uniref:neutral phospholipase A2 3-like n=1 Tax=Orbicella faveolata TaxID=48498 RepID=UPI0009E4B5DB|nr:neutral phospholipase A2 3-like [Orbicella faveolata]